MRIPEIKNIMATSSQQKETVLFICTFNCIRSQIAEGLMRHHYGDRFEVFSAGVAPVAVSSYTVRVMEEIGIDISCQRSKSLREFNGRRFDYVITLCDAARSVCGTSLPEAGTYLHKRFDSPDEFADNEKQILREFRDVREEIQRWLTRTFGKVEEKSQ